MMKKILTALAAVVLVAAQAEVAGHGHDATPQVEPEPASHGHDSVGTFCFINNLTFVEFVIILSTIYFYQNKQKIKK